MGVLDFCGFWFVFLVLGLLWVVGIGITDGFVGFVDVVALLVVDGLLGFAGGRWS